MIFGTQISCDTNLVDLRYIAQTCKFCLKIVQCSFVAQKSVRGRVSESESWFNLKSGRDPQIRELFFFFFLLVSYLRLSQRIYKMSAGQLGALVKHTSRFQTCI